MKLDAIKHQGVTSAQVGQKLLSVEKVAEDAGESRNQVKRYIRLTYLIPELLEMVDENKIAFNPAVEISYLEQSEQRVLLNAMELNDCTPSHAQSIRLKKLSQEGVLQDRTIYDILAEQKPNQQEQYKFKREDIRKYFPKSYTDKQVCDTVIKLLEQWQRRRERGRGSPLFPDCNETNRTVERTAPAGYNGLVGAGLSCVKAKKGVLQIGIRTSTG